MKTIGLLDQGLTYVKLYDTTAIHAAKALVLAIEEERASQSRSGPAPVETRLLIMGSV